MKVNLPASFALAHLEAPGHFAVMDLRVTLAVIAATLAVGIFAGWRGARPWDPARGGVRMIPWRLIMVMSGAAMFLLLVHLGALLGAPTAPAFPGA